MGARSTHAFRCAEPVGTDLLGQNAVAEQACSSILLAPALIPILTYV